MGTPAQIGKSQYRAALNEARQSNINIKRILRRMMDEIPGQLVKVLVGQVALELSDNESALQKLDEIGNTLKNSKRDE